MDTSRVEELMSDQVITMRPDETVQRARDMMGRRDLRHIPVVDEGGVVLGILSDRDLLSAFGRDADAISSVMTKDPLTVFSDTPAYEAAALMIHHRFGALPVIDADRKIVGIVTETDLLMQAHEALRRMASPDAATPEVETRIEHAALRAKLDRVRRARYPDTAVVELRDLCMFLVRHFGREESADGLFARVREAAPDLAPKADALVAQHAQILELINTLVDDNLRLAETGSVEVGRGVEDLVARLVEHEKRETELARRITG